MSDESNKALLNIDTHTLPDDYPFSVDELDRIIAFIFTHRRNRLRKSEEHAGLFPSLPVKIWTN